MLKNMRKSGDANLVAFADIYFDDQVTVTYMINTIDDGGGSTKRIKNNEEEAYNYLLSL
jgi:hypothetical protein